MKKNLMFVLILAASLIAGCAGTAARVQSDIRLSPGEKLNFKIATPATMSEEASTIFRERLAAQLSGGGLLASNADKSARTLDVGVTTYNMRHGATRALVGIFAGTDKMLSTIKIKDTANANTVSEFVVESSNPTAWGTSRGMIEDHADKIVETLKNGK